MASFFFAADTGTLPYASEFDVVIALDVLEHIDDDRAALVHCARSSNLVVA